MPSAGVSEFRSKVFQNFSTRVHISVPRVTVTPSRFPFPHSPSARSRPAARHDTIDYPPGAGKRSEPRTPRDGDGKVHTKMSAKRPGFIPEKVQRLTFHPSARAKLYPEMKFLLIYASNPEMTSKLALSMQSEDKTLPHLSELVTDTTQFHIYHQSLSKQCKFITAQKVSRWRVRP